MKYYVVEVQKMPEGNYSHLVHTADSRNQAESVYHQVLASAAIANLPQHSAILFTDEGYPIMHQAYKHDYVPPVEPEIPVDPEIPAE